MKKIFAIICPLIFFTIASNLIYAEQSSVDTKYVFLDDLEMYIFLKSKPCSLTENQMIGFKATLLSLGNTSKISRYKNIHSWEKLNEAYGYSLNIHKLKTCTTESLEKPNQKLRDSEEE